MNLNKICIVLVFILPLTAVEKQALENHIDDDPVDSQVKAKVDSQAKVKELRKKADKADMKIKKALEEKKKAKALKTTTEAVTNNPVTTSPSSTGKKTNDNQVSNWTEFAENIPEQSADPQFHPLRVKGYNSWVISSKIPQFLLSDQKLL